MIASDAFILVLKIQIFDLLDSCTFFFLYKEHCYWFAVFKGIPDEPGRLCDGETSKWTQYDLAD